MMALTVDATTTKIVSAGATSTSWSHTVGTASKNSCLIVGVSLALDGSGAAPTTISATYNSVSMTKSGELNAESGDTLVALFYMNRPSTGSNTVALSWTGSSIGAFYAVSLYNADFGSPIREGSYTTAVPTNAGTISVAVPSNSGDIVFDVVHGSYPFRFAVYLRGCFALAGCPFIDLVDVVADGLGREWDAGQRVNFAVLQGPDGGGGNRQVLGNLRYRQISSVLLRINIAGSCYLLCSH
jgi:hypothetical protein